MSLGAGSGRTEAPHSPQLRRSSGARGPAPPAPALQTLPKARGRSAQGTSPARPAFRRSPPSFSSAFLLPPHPSLPFPSFPRTPLPFLPHAPLPLLFLPRIPRSRVSSRVSLTPLGRVHLPFSWAPLWVTCCRLPSAGTRKGHLKSSF